MSTAHATIYTATFIFAAGTLDETFHALDREIALIVKSIPGYTPEMIVLALCCGGTCLSHVNDAGFWIVNQYFGMTVPQTLRSWTVMKVITSLTGIGVVLAAQAIRSS